MKRETMQKKREKNPAESIHLAWYDM